MHLANKLHFKAKWKTSFLNSTCEPLFSFFTKHNEGSSDFNRVEMMRFNIIRGQKLNFAMNSYTKICEFPFADNCSFFVLLPDNMKALESNLNAKSFESLLSCMEPRSISSLFPRFSLKGKMDVTKILKNLGFKKAFEPSPYGLAIRESISFSQIRIDNTGADSCTSNHFVLTHEQPKIRKVIGHAKFNEDMYEQDFNCDKPFIFVIKDTKTGLILFMGKLMVPAFEIKNIVNII